MTGGQIALRHVSAIVKLPDQLTNDAMNQNRSLLLNLRMHVDQQRIVFQDAVMNRMLIAMTDPIVLPGRYKNLERIYAEIPRAFFALSEQKRADVCAHKIFTVNHRCRPFRRHAFLKGETKVSLILLLN